MKKESVTGSQYNPSYDSGEGMKVKVVKLIGKNCCNTIFLAKNIFSSILSHELFYCSSSLNLLSAEWFNCPKVNVRVQVVHQMFKQLDQLFKSPITYLTVVIILLDPLH